MSPLSRILFVDDEVHVVESLRDRLRRHRRRWDMHFVTGGQAAIDALAVQSFDVVITDLRMPRVDGFAVLDHLRREHPTTVRVVLSGDPQRETALRLVPSAHRVLVKPCRAGELETALESACRLGELISDPSVRALIGRIAELPPMPRTYARLVQVLEDDRTSFADVGDVLSSDIALSAKILQLANSPVFGGGRAASSITQAIGLLGTDVLRTIVLSEGVLGRRELPVPARRFAAELHAHSFLVAHVAAQLAIEVPVRRDAFAAGMLHDLGRLVIALEMPDSSGSALETSDHARIGAYLLGLWGVPAPILDAVARHHDPNLGDTSPITQLVAEAESVVEEVDTIDLPAESRVEEATRRALTRRQR